MSDKLVKQDNSLAEYKDINIESLLIHAIDKQIPVETIERLLAMRKELKTEQAKEQYFIALSEFQSECPIIQKTKIVYNKDGKTIRYRYAPLDSIINQIKDVIKKFGFSYIIHAKYEDKAQIATCVVHHKDGHSENSEFRSPILSDTYMNNIQQNASSLTYAKRYAFCNAFGILTSDEDTDAVDIEDINVKSENKTQEQKNQEPEKQQKNNNLETLKKQIATALMAICNNDKEKAQAKLKEFTAFGSYQGTKDTKNIKSEKQAWVILNKKIQPEFEQLYLWDEFIKTGKLEQIIFPDEVQKIQQAFEEDLPFGNTSQTPESAREN